MEAAHYISDLGAPDPVAIVMSAVFIVFGVWLIGTCIYKMWRG